MYLCLEYEAGGDMFTLLQKHGPLPESAAAFYIGQVVLAIRYLHSLSIVHRDIKPENVMLDSTGHVKLTDFGLHPLTPPLSCSEAN